MSFVNDLDDLGSDWTGNNAISKRTDMIYPEATYIKVKFEDSQRDCEGIVKSTQRRPMVVLKASISTSLIAPTSRV